MKNRLQFQRGKKQRETMTGLKRKNRLTEEHKKINWGLPVLMNEKGTRNRLKRKKDKLKLVRQTGVDRKGR